MSDSNDGPPSSGGLKKKRVGFATMDKERLAEISAKGGAAVPHDARSFAQNRELARKAGAKGGKASKGGGRKRSLSASLQSILRGEQPK